MQVLTTGLTHSTSICRGMPKISKERGDATLSKQATPVSPGNVLHLVRPVTQCQVSPRGTSTALTVWWCALQSATRCPKTRATTGMAEHNVLTGRSQTHACTCCWGQLRLGLAMLQQMCSLRGRWSPLGLKTAVLGRKHLHRTMPLRWLAVQQRQQGHL
jgi:hypothetical protein